MWTQTLKEEENERIPLPLCFEILHHFQEFIIFPLLILEHVFYCLEVGESIICGESLRLLIRPAHVW